MKCYIYFLMLITCGCSKHQKSTEGTDNSRIDLVPITQIDEKLSYLKIDTMPNGYLVSYSKPMVNSGGYKINKLESTGRLRTLMQNPINNMQYVQVKDSFLGFIENNFKKGELSSELIFSRNYGSSWDSLVTPLDNLRTFFWDNNFLALEGNLNGIGQVVISNNNGKDWINYNYLARNIKSLYLIDYIDEKILFKAYNSYNEKDGFLGLLDVNKFSFERLIGSSPKLVELFFLVIP